MQHGRFTIDVRQLRYVESGASVNSTVQYMHATLVILMSIAPNSQECIKRYLAQMEVVYVSLR